MTESAEAASPRPPLSGLVIIGATAAGAVLFGGLGLVIALVRIEAREWCELDCVLFNMFLWVLAGLGFGLLLALRTALRVERIGTLRARVVLAALSAFILGASLASWAAVQIDERTQGGLDQSHWMLGGALVAGILASVIAGGRRARALRRAEDNAG